MPRTRLPLRLLACALLAAAGGVVAQEPADAAQEEGLSLPPPPVVAPQENVRIEFARVLAAEPVFQTLRATSMVERCDPVSPVAGEPERRGLSRVVGAVRDVLTPTEDDGEEDAHDGAECRMVPVEREFRRPIGYDVDYVHRGVTYRSRMPYDPGNRVRVRVSVTPVVSPDP
ncbi:hypothetical protein ACOPJQ_11050 [Luteimonas dalianensis]|uniref:hypothetical protein n=1 Tax=Luteimonas dalianensis TaxID=1148196 RepID=UPI003BF4D032